MLYSIRIWKSDTSSCSYNLFLLLIHKQHHFSSVSTYVTILQLEMYIFTIIIIIILMFSCENHTQTHEIWKYFCHLSSSTSREQTMSGFYIFHWNEMMFKFLIKKFHHFEFVCDFRNGVFYFILYSSMRSTFSRFFLVRHVVAKNHSFHFIPLLCLILLLLWTMCSEHMVWVLH